MFQEEILIVMSGEGILHHGDERVPVGPGDCICYLPEDPEAHTFENTGAAEAVIWAFGNRFNHEVALYPDQGLAFVEGLGAEVPLAAVAPIRLAPRSAGSADAPRAKALLSATRRRYSPPFLRCRKRTKARIIASTASGMPMP